MNTDMNANMDMDNKNNKKNKNRLIKIIGGIAGLVLVFLLGIALSNRLYNWGDDTVNVAQDDAPLETAKPALTEEEQEAQYRAMKDAMADSDQNDGGEEGSDPENLQKISETQTVSDYEGHIDFEYLWNINEDIYAWITISGTDIDYPVLQHPTDDTFYLNHNVDGSYGYPSCIYTEKINAKDFSDPNTVIYGHNMKNKTMFQQLHSFESKDFFEKYGEVIIYLPDRTLHYQVFAAYVYDDRHLMYSFDFWNEDVFTNYLESIYDIRDMSANIDRDITVTAENRIITMVTCMPNKSDADKRLLVHAVLIEEELNEI